MAARPDYYQVLGVSRTASQEEIQRAYRRLARAYHPDLNPDPGAEERFKQISEAYHVLSDPQSRRRYEAAGGREEPPAGWRRGPGARQWPPGGRQREPTGWFRPGSAEDTDLEDLLSGLFGGARRRRWEPFRGPDQDAELPLSVEDAYHGGQRSLTLTDPAGSRTYEVTIPPGVTDGQRIRLGGQGARGMPGAAPGDLYLVVRLRPHSRYRVEGRHLAVDLPLAPWEAALGASVAVATPAGPVRVRVPGGTSSGRRLRLRGHGMPDPGGQPGDLFADVRIVVPPRLSEEQRRLFQQLAATSGFDPRLP
jgi:curved DNA-binding protein